jgi:hypothetical protein
MPRTGRPSKRNLCSSDISPASAAGRVAVRVARCRHSASALASARRVARPSSWRTALAGLPTISEPSGNSLPSVTSDAGADEAAAADARAVEYHGADADQRRRRWCSRAASPGGPRSRRSPSVSGTAGIGVQYRSVLHVAARADADPVVVAAQHAAVPHAAVLARLDAADHLRRCRPPRPSGQLPGHRPRIGRGPRAASR